MSSLFLDEQELEALSGFKRPSAQRRWLERNGIPYIVGGDNRPRVLQSVVLSKMSGQKVGPTKEPKLRLRNGTTSAS